MRLHDCTIFFLFFEAVVFLKRRENIYTHPRLRQAQLSDLLKLGN